MNALGVRLDEASLVIDREGDSFTDFSFHERLFQVTFEFR